MPDDVSATEAGAGIAEAAHEKGAHRHTLISIAEAVLLSVVTLVAAWSGYSAAKWSTESDIELSNASIARSHANRAYQESVTVRTLDATGFNAWFTAYLAGKKDEQDVAQKRFRDEYNVAFEAWLATDPFNNPDAPKGPQYMPQYRPPGEAEAKHFDAESDAEFAAGEKAASHSDEYVRVTVILASVLFLVGIGSHFPIARIRYGLAVVGGVLLLFAAFEILQLPAPPT